MINDMQIEFSINEFSKEINERITIDELIDTNFIDHGKYFVLNKIFMQKKIYIFIIGKFG